MKEFSRFAKESLASIIQSRRDIRHFRSDPIPDEIIRKILESAHAAPSVGFSQPWNFLLIRGEATKQEVFQVFKRENDRAAELFSESRKETYQSLKLQGLLDSPLHCVVTCDSDRNGPVVLGRTSVPETDVYSTCLAIQNLWLTSRAYGIGVGWMSIYDPDQLREILKIPSHIQMIAYLCLGYPVEFPEEPILSRVGWKTRENLGDLIFSETWGNEWEGSSREIPGDKGNQVKSIPGSQISQEEVFDLPWFEKRIQNLAKPVGSLGRLEELAGQIARIQNRKYPRLDRKSILIFGGDHGISEEGVSLFQKETTHRLVYQYLAGSGAVSALARQTNSELKILDFGIDHTFSSNADLMDYKVRNGTRNFRKGFALTEEEVQASIQKGRDLWRELNLDNFDLLVPGEIGIGNTTAAVGLFHAVNGFPLRRDLVGKGTGLQGEALEKKQRILEEALDTLYRGHPQPILPVLCLEKFGGLEIGGMMGFILESKNYNSVILLDGMVSTIAAYLAEKECPGSTKNCLGSHLSPEPIHKILLRELNLIPVFDLEMRLGEGSGAAVAISLLESSVVLFNEMKTWDEVNWFGKIPNQDTKIRS